MRKSIPFFVGMLCLLLSSSIYSQCEDPNNQVLITTDCGTQFDLCIDRDTIDLLDDLEGEIPGIRINIAANDSLGLYDICLSDTTSGVSNGTLIMLDDCSWFYRPDPGFVGNDTFYYMLNVFDTCATDITYCEDGSGKIWTIYSAYTGPAGATIQVNNSKGQKELLGEFTNLSPGDFFLADGTGIIHNNTEWTFKVFLDGDTTGDPDDVVQIHTSCSDPNIFNIQHAFFRTISGCSATSGNGNNGVSDCIGETGNAMERVRTKTRGASMITTASEDETMVIITVLSSSLPLKLGHFKADAMNDYNKVSWAVVSSIGEESMILEKSTNGIDFFPIKTFSSIKSKTYNYNDKDFNNKNSYYRLKSENYDGQISYSNIAYLNRLINREVTIFPNPINDQFVIKIRDNKEIVDMSNLELMSLDGRRMLIKSNFKIDSRGLEIDRNNIPSGIYLLRMQFEDGDMQVSKIIFK